MSYKDIAQLTTTGMALTTATNAFPSFGKKKKKKITKTAVESILGVSLSKEVAGIVGSL